MPLDFPSAPSVGDIYTYNGRSWQYNGSAWALLATSSINNTPIGNVAANSGAFTTVTATGNVTTNGYFVGDGSQLSNVSASNISSGNSNVSVLSANGNIAVSVAGNSNVVVFGSGQIDIKANVVPATANVFSLGNATHRWANLWVSGNTITLGNIVLKDSGSATLAVYGSDGVTTANILGTVINGSGFSYTAPNIATTGNISNVYNTLSTGPVTINSGVTITVDNNAVWTIV